VPTPLWTCGFCEWVRDSIYRAVVQGLRHFRFVLVAFLQCQKRCKYYLKLSPVQLLATCVMVKARLYLAQNSISLTAPHRFSLGQHQNISRLHRYTVRTPSNPFIVTSHHANNDNPGPHFSGPLASVPYLSAALQGSSETGSQILRSFQLLFLYIRYLMSRELHGETET
jgi:hypothetical protein